MKNNCRILFAVVIFALLAPFAVLGQEQAQFKGEDLLKKLKLMPEAESLPAPDFVAVTLDGKKISLESLKGKLVLLNFWATWCPPCRLEMPTMEKIYKEFKGESLDVVAMNFMEGPEPINLFLKEHNFTFTILMDRDGKIAESYGVRVLPVSFLIGRRGNVLARSIGYKDWHNKDTRQFISLLLKDEGIIHQKVIVEVRKGFWQGERWRQPLVLGSAALILLVISVSSIWIYKAFFIKK
jgi:thiol-disulfide isomerase/thioredoxin